MKNHHILLMALLCPILSFAQFTNQEYITIEREWGNTNTLLLANGKTYVGGYHFECAGPLLYTLDSNNQILFHDDLDIQACGVHDLDVNPATQAIAGCTHHGEFGEIFGEENGPALFSFDEDGNNVFTTILDYATYGIESSGLTSLTHTNDGGWVMATDEYLLWFSSIGELLEVQEFDESVHFQTIEWVSENQLVAVTETDLLILDHDGNTLQTQGYAGIRSIFVEGGIIYCLRETELIAYNLSDQTMVTTSDYLTNIDMPQGICGNSSSLFIYETMNLDQNFEKIIELEKATLQYVDEFYFEKENTELNGVVANEETIFFGGTMSITNPLDLSTGWSSGRFSFLKSTSIFEEPLFTGNDIGISNFTIVDPLVPIDTVEIDFTTYVYFETPYVNVTYDLTNNGSAPANVFGLLSNTTGYGNWCVDLRVYKNQSDYVVNPGETVTMHDTFFIMTFVYLESLPNLELSLSAFGPNYLFDGDLSNNVALMQGSLVGEWEPEELSGIFVFPNPITKSLNLKFETTYPDANLLVYDIFGKLIYEQSVNNHEYMNVVTESWPSGIYVVMVRDNNKVFTEKIVKI